MPRRVARQLEMTLPAPRTWGGRRKGAGRKRSKRSGVPHLQRPALASRFPVHVTLKVHRSLRSLRTKRRVKVLRQAFIRGCRQERFRIIDWSLQGDHIHLLVEAHNATALSRGIQGFSIRVARALNRLSGRTGAVFADRYHARILRTPREVRNARSYVLNNHHHHNVTRGCMVIGEHPDDRLGIDPYSSWAWFDGWRNLPARDVSWAEKVREGPPQAAAAQTWLMRVGWRRHGLVAVDELPSSAR